MRDKILDLTAVTIARKGGQDKKHPESRDRSVPASVYDLEEDEKQKRWWWIGKETAKGEMECKQDYGEISHKRERKAGPQSETTTCRRFSPGQHVDLTDEQKESSRVSCGVRESSRGAGNRDERGTPLFPAFLLVGFCFFSISVRTMTGQEGC
ncbi:uncharacterized protein SPSK_05643 [Sporothrix schenckii 1099-18]|uniref:Uncharacterized protein n=1 Tax=Sporothrix schenckii 1099-18 TaxID=1397361 RepID=A0A0F2LTS3_SPOSC|nr:uncharacterized protein SPSK_05643 [Sporothrix schenckii 1099-18]KJR80254.1 hypothetical protein SPSK_05643 [Sporothrix schenckii 1099-18]